MLEDIEQLKKQLSELSEVINSFKSEAVQLKILEYIFKGASGPPPSNETSGTRKRRRKRGAPKTECDTSDDNAAKSSGRPRRGGKGGSATLSDLIEGDFFNQKRTIGNILEHCEHVLARRFKASDLSGPLVRHTRSGTLSRAKNAEGQYEYVKP